MKVSVSVSVSIFGSAWYQYQYQYRNFRPAEYQYRIGIEFVDQESISIVSEKMVSKGSGKDGSCKSSSSVYLEV